MRSEMCGMVLDSKSGEYRITVGDRSYILSDRMCEQVFRSLGEHLLVGRRNGWRKFVYTLAALLKVDRDD